MCESRPISPVSRASTEVSETKEAVCPIRRDEKEGLSQSGEAVEEKVSLSDRFGLWLGFHPCDQDQYLQMIKGYCAAYSLEIKSDILQAQAIEWQATRGSRSGRVAWQFFVDLAGRHGALL